MLIAMTCFFKKIFFFSKTVKNKSFFPFLIDTLHFLMIPQMGQNTFTIYSCFEIQISINKQKVDEKIIIKKHTKHTKKMRLSEILKIFFLRCLQFWQKNEFQYCNRMNNGKWSQNLSIIYQRCADECEMNEKYQKQLVIHEHTSM